MAGSGSALCNVGDLKSEVPVMAERNWVPAWWLSVSTEIFGIAMFAQSCVDQDYEPAWPIRITGEIKR